MIRNFFRHIPLPVRQKKFLKFAYFFLAARLGIVERPALNGLDRKLEKYLPFKGGVFIEAGANDGITQSNSWYFEAYRGWTGLLIEPIPELADMARRFRKSPVENVALCALRNDGADIFLSENDLVTKVSEAGRDTFKIKGRALSRLLDEHGMSRIDLFSLDVEGFELEVLDGLDLARHAPAWILIETADIGAVLQKLGARYAICDKFSHHDYLLQRQGS